MSAKQVPPEEGGPGWWFGPLKDANTRRFELARRVGFLETTIRLAIIELSSIEKVSATGARVAKVLRDAVEKT